MDQLNVVYPYNGKLFTHKRNEVLIHAIWVRLENFVLREVNHLDKMSTIVKSMETEVDLWLPTAECFEWGWRMNWYEVSFWGDENVELDGCTTV